MGLAAGEMQRPRSLALIALLSFASLALFGFGPCSRGGSASSSSSRPTAPSTGNELPGTPQHRLSPADARAAVASAMTEYKKGASKDCKKVVKGLVSGLPDDVTSDDEPAFVALADCAQQAKRYSLMREATVRVMRFDKNFAHPAYLPEAEIGLGYYDRALTDVDRLLRARPKDPELSYARGLVPCKQMVWPDCLRGMNDAVKLAHIAKMQDEKTFEGNADVHRADSMMHMGQVPQAQATIDAAAKLGGDANDVAGIRKDLVPAKQAKVVVDEFHQSEIPLGNYHLYGKAKSAGVPAQIWVYNIGPKDRQFRVEAEIVGVTDKFSTTVTVLKGGVETVPLVPPLRSTFDVKAQRSEMPTQLHVKVTGLDAGKENVAYDESDEVKVLPRDSLLLAVHVDEDAIRPIDDYMGAWVTPNAKAVDEFLKAAKKRAPQETFAGTQTATLPQVQAIYDELHDRGVSYVMDPEVVSETVFAQRTRLPSDVLASQNAQCLEGAILFATLMEAIGLDPVIVRIPGHAFVGWHTARDPVADGTRMYVETTMVHTANFADAVKFAKQEVDHQESLSHFDEGISRLIEVKELRARGITPQPWD
jgi:hypothetical protein